MAPHEAGLNLLDSGCGTGYYLAGLLERRDDWRALALDVSVDAVAVATRTADSPGLVADVWQPLAVRDDRADVVLCVFAPRNVSEFARVLSAEGRLVVVTPALNHLEQLRDAGRVIGIQDDKLAHLDASLAGPFRLERRESLEYRVRLDDAELDSLASMGPSGHHETVGGPAGDEPNDHTTVTIAVDVSSYSLA